MEEKKEAAKKIKCLTLNEPKDVQSFGSSDLSSKTYLLTFVLNDSAFKKCEELKYVKDFIIHYYIGDTFDTDMIIGVNRFELCSVSFINDTKNIVKIKASNKIFYNMSELKLLRKDKIGNFLLGITDEDAII